MGKRDLKTLLFIRDSYAALSGEPRGKICEVHESPYLLCDHKKVTYGAIEITAEQWDKIKGYKDSKKGYLFYDSKKSEIKFKEVK